MIAPASGTRQLIYGCIMKVSSKSMLDTSFPLDPYIPYLRAAE